MKFQTLFLAAGLMLSTQVALAQKAPAKLYIVQLTDAPVASYRGTFPGLASTRAQAGSRLDAHSTAARRYESHLAQRRDAVLASLGQVRPLHTYTVTFNGFSARLTDAQVRALRGRPDVVSIQESRPVKLDTTHTPEFLGLTRPGGLWSTLDRNALPVKGEDVIIGVIDSGVWPEDAAFGDRRDSQGAYVPYYGNGTPAYTAPPAKWRGICQTGEGFTAAMCNNKIVGARWYVDGFIAQGEPVGPEAGLSPLEYRSARASTAGSGGHGSHTAGTAGGNENVRMTLGGVGVGAGSGVAPRARLAIYKACWEAANGQYSSCGGADLVKAIDDAVRDGVDVINYSISGTSANFNDPMEQAFLNASAAGVFVAASAGNSGPARTAAHPSPWITTVGASTHDRFLVATLTLGNGSPLTGASFQATGVARSPLLLARDAAEKPFEQLSPVDQRALELCFTADDRVTLGGGPDAALSRTKTQGRILVCQRGESGVLEKAVAAKEAGAVAMVLLDTPTSQNTQYSMPYALPTVHLTVASYPTLMAYGATKGPTATLSPSSQLPGVAAPVMAGFSSRGPNFGSEDILKPDITAPGQDIIAAWTDTTLTQAQRDAVANNTYIPKSSSVSISGTSMSSPHLAGVAALLKQLHPTWSPAAIKSAIQTTTGRVLLADGSLDGDRFGYGAGHVNPNAAANPGLVYDATTVDYARFLCGQGLLAPAGSGSCAELGPIKAYDLNLATLTAGEVRGPLTLNRRVTNVGTATATYVATASLPGWDVKVTPSTLTLAPGASASFTVQLAPTTAPVGEWGFGRLVWSSGTQEVVSPLTARAGAFKLPASISDQRPTGRGTKTFQVTSNYTGALQVQATGVIAPTQVISETMLPYYGVCYNLEVPADTELVSVRMFEDETVVNAPTALGLDLWMLDGPNATGALITGSSNPGNTEEMTLIKPRAGTYSACVMDFTSPALAGSTFKLNYYVMAPGVPRIPMRATGPTSVYRGGTATIATGWDVPVNQRYVGVVKLIDPASNTLGTTHIMLDTKPRP